MRIFQVYLIKHRNSHALYEGWLCGGAIIHPLHVLTSATCVKDVYNVYVISGLTEYTPERELIEENTCARKTRRKIVSLCEFRS